MFNQKEWVSITVVFYNAQAVFGGYFVTVFYKVLDQFCAQKDACHRSVKIYMALIQMGNIWILFDTVHHVSDMIVDIIIASYELTVTMTTK